MTVEARGVAQPQVISVRPERARAKRPAARRHPATECGVPVASHSRSCRASLRRNTEALTHSNPSSPLRQLRTKTFTLREIEVVQLVAEGLSNDKIASRLFVSPRTVQTHVANAMRKAGCANRTALGVLALREGLVPLHEPAATTDEPTDRDIDTELTPA